MVALIILLLILAVFGAAGFAIHVLWFVLVAAVVLWILGFFVGAWWSMVKQVAASKRPRAGAGGTGAGDRCRTDPSVQRVVGPRNLVSFAFECLQPL